MKGKKTGGREKGTPNKLTKDIREAYETLINNNIDKLDKWLNDIAKDSPARAFDIILKLSEFVTPKLNKETVTNKREFENDEIANMTDEEIERLKKEQIVIVTQDEQDKKEISEALKDIV